MNTQNKIIDKETLKNAIISTSKHRGIEEIIKNWEKVIEMISDDKKMIQMWEKYYESIRK